MGRNSDHRNILNMSTFATNDFHPVYLRLIYSVYFKLITTIFTILRNSHENSFLHIKNLYHNYKTLTVKV